MPLAHASPGQSIWRSANGSKARSSSDPTATARPARRRADRAPGRSPCRIGKRVGPHTLRHAFITAALDAGVPLRDVQKRPVTPTRARRCAMTVAASRWTATPPTSSPRSSPALPADNQHSGVRCRARARTGRRTQPPTRPERPRETVAPSMGHDEQGRAWFAHRLRTGHSERVGPVRDHTSAELSHPSAEARHRGSCRTRKRFSTRVMARIAGSRTAVISRSRTPVCVADLPHTIGGRCTASPSVGQRADGVERFRVRAVAAPNGTTERQHRITSEARAEAAHIGIYSPVRVAPSISRYRMVRHRPGTRWGPAHAGARSGWRRWFAGQAGASEALPRTGRERILGTTASDPRQGRGRHGRRCSRFVVAMPGSPMMGEELTESDVTDQAYSAVFAGVVDIETTKVGGATNPKEVADVVRLPGGLHHATGAGSFPPVRVTLPTARPSGPTTPSWRSSCRWHFADR